MPISIAKVKINPDAIKRAIIKARMQQVQALDSPGDCNDFFANCCNCCEPTGPCCGYTNSDTFTIKILSSTCSAIPEGMIIHVGDGWPSPTGLDSNGFYGGEVTDCGCVFAALNCYPQPNEEDTRWHLQIYVFKNIEVITGPGASEDTYCNEQEYPEGVRLCMTVSSDSEGIATIDLDCNTCITEATLYQNTSNDSEECDECCGDFESHTVVAEINCDPKQCCPERIWSEDWPANLFFTFDNVSDCCTAAAGDGSSFGGPPGSWRLSSGGGMLPNYSFDYGNVLSCVVNGNNVSSEFDFEIYCGLVEEGRWTITTNYAEGGDVPVNVVMDYGIDVISCDPFYAEGYVTLNVYGEVIINSVLICDSPITITFTIVE